ncbi:MAG: hypothetical protein ACR2FV_18170 [Ornithinimicrobium sp.]|uniref:hypothetical protein n=1 Tax=Ornithinimicrobium sp. TaxID=1977084 RepID=UPI003D9BA0FB
MASVGYWLAPDDMWVWLLSNGLALTWVSFTTYLERRWKVSDRASVTHGPAVSRD